VQINIKNIFRIFFANKIAVLAKERRKHVFLLPQRVWGNDQEHEVFFSEVTGLQSFVWLVPGKLAPLAFLLAQRFVFWLVQIFLQPKTNFRPHLPAPLFLPSS
jgi:hypothetical protein